jgi:2-oxo-3-hexenedioate decarboxylase
MSALAQRLDEAALTCRAVPQSGDALSVEDAYLVQELLIDRRLQRGEKLIGVKMGFTSRAKMLQMGVSDLIWGRLTDAMRLEDGASADPSRFIHPRIEPEVAFLIGEGGMMEAVAPALEIIDSRFENFKFSLSDVIADNASSSAFVLGNWQKPPADLSNLGMVMSLNGRAKQIGSTGAILGDPRRSLAAAARLSGGLQAGWIVLAGAGTNAEPFPSGTHASVEIEGLGRADISMLGEGK